MIYSFLADLLVVFHLVFILYVMAGALLIFKWPFKNQQSTCHHIKDEHQVEHHQQIGKE